MATANAPPPQFFSPGQAVPPPTKKTRAGTTPGTEKVLDATDQAMARRRAELDRLKQMQKQHVPIIDRARDQLEGRGPPGNNSSTFGTPNRPPPMIPPTGIAPPTAGTPKSNVASPVAAQSGPLSRRLEESFASSPNTDADRNSTGPPPVISPPGKKNIGVSNNSSNPPPPIHSAATMSPGDQRGPITRAGEGANIPSNGSASTKPSVGPPTSIPPTNSTPIKGPPRLPPPGNSPNTTTAFVSADSISQAKPKPQVTFGPSPNIPESENGDLISNDSPSLNTQDTTFTSAETSNRVAMAGHTPFHKISNNPSTPVDTPEITSPSYEVPPPSTGRREILNTMRSYADTPPAKQLPNSKAVPTNGNKEKKHVGFLSPVMNLGTPGGNSLISSTLALSKRAPTPHPKLSRAITALEDHLVEAAETVTFEYESDAAIFTIRRPYGLATETELWFSAGYLNSKMYAKNANVTKPETFEVVATINFDGSTLALHGDVEVKHRLYGEAKWKEYGNIRDNDTVLGNITYIDQFANELQYSLDAICEGALSVREHYCSSVLSTGEAFRLRKDTLPKLNYPSDDIGAVDTVSPLKPATTDASVGTEELTDAKIKNESQPTSRPPPIEDEAYESSSDVLSAAVNLFFSTIFGTIWFVFVRIPFMILVHLFVLVVAAVLLGVIRTYLAHDNGASEIGAILKSMFNQPGVL